MNKRLDWVSTFAVEICLSHGAENFRRGIFYCCINFGRRKSLDKRGEGDFRIFRRKFFVSQCRNFRGANPIVFHFFSAIENVCIRGGGRVSRFSVGNFLCHSAEKLRRGNCFCCINFGCRKSLDKGGGLSGFSVEKYLSHSAENFGRGTLSCFTKFVYRKIL